MPKKKLNKDDFKPPQEYEILGICSHLKDYSLAWNLNKALNINLRKTKDFSNYVGKNLDNILFSSYFYEDPINLTTYIIISNHQVGRVLIPEYKHIHYLAFIKRPINNHNLFSETVKKITNVLGVYTVDNEKVKHLESIMADIEYHLLEI